jgi:hypothetical protein
LALCVDTYIEHDFGGQLYSSVNQQCIYSIVSTIQANMMIPRLENLYWRSLVDKTFDDQAFLNLVSNWLIFATFDAERPF